MSALSELLTQANTEGLSLQRITDLMRQRGHQISRDTVWKYMSGSHPTPKREYLLAFVDVFPSLKLPQLEKAASIPTDLGIYEPPPEANALNPQEREALDLIIKSMARGKVFEARSTGSGKSHALGLVVLHEDHQVPEAAMEDPPKGRKRSRPGESEEPWTER